MQKCSLGTSHLDAITNACTDQSRRITVPGTNPVPANPPPSAGPPSGSSPGRRNHTLLAGLSTCDSNLPGQGKIKKEEILLAGWAGQPPGRPTTSLRSVCRTEKRCMAETLQDALRHGRHVEGQDDRLLLRQLLPAAAPHLIEARLGPRAARHRPGAPPPPPPRPARPAGTAPPTGPGAAAATRPSWGMPGAMRGPTYDWCAELQPGGGIKVLRGFAGENAAGVENRNRK